MAVLLNEGMTRIESSLSTMSTCTLGDRCNTHTFFKDFEELITEAENGQLSVGSCDEKTQLIKVINAGAFGIIFLGEFLPNKREKVAVKMEKQNTGCEKVLSEGNILRHLEGGQGIPKVYTFGMHGRKYNYLVEELLGHSLSYFQEKCNGHFTLKTILLLIDQTVDIMDYVHGQGYMHRDISPSNFVMGHGTNKDKVYIIDFGMSKKNIKRGSFLMEGHRKSFTVPHTVDGTPRYVSLSAHLGDGNNYRDDLEALGYMWVHLLKGKLPWQGIAAPSHIEKLAKIHQIKAQLSGKEICEGLPDEFALYIEYCRNLKSSEAPNYKAIRKMFRDLAEKHDIVYDFIYDWSKTPPTPIQLSPTIYNIRCESLSSPRSLQTHKKLRQMFMPQQYPFGSIGEGQT